MREIEFRGKRKDNGEWVAGDLRHTQDFFGEKFEDTIHILEPGHGMGHLIIPETVGQYTGLKDKNASKIFEGDIVKVNDSIISTYKPSMTNYNYTVCFDEGCFILRGNYEAEWTCDGICMQHIICREENRLLIIGNIHDNPEILKERT